MTSAAGAARGFVEALRTARGYAGGGLVSSLDSNVLTQGFSGVLGHNGIVMAARLQQRLSTPLVPVVFPLLAGPVEQASQGIQEYRPRILPSVAATVR